jgi:NAD-dependent dihydropyrimidine dehydrogenase PreA subunit
MPGAQPLSYHQLIVGRYPTGLSGLDEMFESLYASGRPPDDALASELVSRAREHNYIPAPAEGQFAAALFCAYQDFCDRRRSGQPPPAKREAWQGMPREQVPWFPTLDETQCDGCDKCRQFCAHGVFAKRDDGIVHVVEPMNCVVGCDACERLCSHHAISFPPRNILQPMTCQPLLHP